MCAGLASLPPRRPLEWHRSPCPFFIFSFFLAAPLSAIVSVSATQTPLQRTSGDSEEEPGDEWYETLWFYIVCGVVAVFLVCFLCVLCRRAHGDNSGRGTWKAGGECCTDRWIRRLCWGYSQVSGAGGSTNLFFASLCPRGGCRYTCLLCRDTPRVCETMRLGCVV